MPTRGTTEAAGWDLYAAEEATLVPGARRLISTGLSMALRPDLVGLICSRSGLAVKHGVIVLNAPGILDSDYRGEVKVLLVNLGDSNFHVSPGDRIAQLVPAVIPLYSSARDAAGYGVLLGRFIQAVDSLDATDRGGGGFGSTGK
jgi:dUTP pyrophosphatase